MSTALASLRWPEVAPDGRAAPVLVVPVGSLEQHGPALALSTDGVVATAVAQRAVARLAVGTEPSHLVAPLVPYGASGEHEAFPGTVSIGHDALRLVLVELARSACRWAAGVVFVNGHGGNVATLVEATTQLRREGRPVAWSACRAEGADAHAGRTETALMLVLAPETVREALLAPGCTEPLAALMPRLRSHGVRAVSPSGVLGDPTTATPALGRRVLGEMVDGLVAQLTEVDVGADGRLRTPDRVRVAP